MPIFWSVFVINGCWILSKAFSASIEKITWFLSFSFLIWCITLIGLCILKNSCIPGINSTWSWCMSFLMCCWILFARVLLRTFAFMFTSDIGLYFSFFMLSLVLISEWLLLHRMNLEVFLPLQSMFTEILVSNFFPCNIFVGFCY